MNLVIMNLNSCTINIALIWVLYGFQLYFLQTFGVEDMVQVVYDAGSCKFQDSFLLRPQTGKGDVGPRSREDCLRFLGTHRMADEAFLCLSDMFNVQTARTISDETSNCLLAMADTEVDIRMIL